MFFNTTLVKNNSKGVTKCSCSCAFTCLHSSPIHLMTMQINYITKHKQTNKNKTDVKKECQW